MYTLFICNMLINTNVSTYSLILCIDFINNMHDVMCDKISHYYLDLMHIITIYIKLNSNEYLITKTGQLSYI